MRKPGSLCNKLAKLRRLVSQKKYLSQHSLICQPKENPTALTLFEQGRGHWYGSQPEKCGTGGGAYINLGDVRERWRWLFLTLNYLVMLSNSMSV